MIQCMAYAAKLILSLKWSCSPILTSSDSHPVEYNFFTVSIFNFYRHTDNFKRKVNIM